VIDSRAFIAPGVLPAICTLSQKLGVVLSTLLEASDADFRLAVIKDCCADLEPPRP